MHAYAEILSPSVVSHALFASLGQRASPCLVLVRGGSLIQVYSDLDDPRGPRWLAEFALDGVVTQLAALDAVTLVVAFKPAKLVALEWNDTTLTFDTRSLHYYEKLLEASDFGGGDPPAQLAADPVHHCAVFRYSRDAAAVLARREFANPLFPETRSTADSPLKSSELPLSPLIPDEKCSEVADLACLPFYTVPSVAVLYWTEPSWAGLAPTHGDRTKGLAVVSLSVRPTTARGSVVFTIENVPSDVFKIVPVEGADQLMLLIGSSSLSFVDQAGALVEIPLGADAAALRFENCQAAQLPNTPWITLVLESGAVLSVDAAARTLKHLQPAGFAPEPTCIAVSPKNEVLIGSRLSAAKLCRASIQPASTPEPSVSSFSLRKIYDLLVGQHAATPAVLLGLESRFALANVGALSAITPIDDGVVCSAGSSVVIVERELPLIESDRIEPATEVSPGRFWVLQDTPNSSPLLMVSSRTLDQLESEHAAFDDAADDADKSKHAKRRRRSKPARESTLFYDDLRSRRSAGRDHASGRDANHDAPNPKARQRPKQIRAFATDQATLAVDERETETVVVQTHSISLYSTGSWKLLSTTRIPVAHFAEIGADLIVTQHKENDETRVYAATKDFELLKTVKGAELASVCSSTLITANKSWITVSDPRRPDHEGNIYDLTRVPQTAEPQPELVDEGLQVVSIFAFEFDNSAYIGIHLNRLFCIYEPVGDVLVKRFTVPFMVNQSPVWLKSAELLVFPGTQAHVVVKARSAAFACHPLQTDGKDCLDIVSYADPKYKDSKQPSLVWLDHRYRLHFARVDYDVDYTSNKLPYRRVPIDPAISICSLAYHDDTQSVVIGANRSVKYVDPAAATANDKAADEDVEMRDDVQNGDEKASNGDTIKSDEAGEVQPEEEQDEDGQVHAQAFQGCVFILPLSNYRPVEATEVELGKYETVVSLECVDHGNAGGQQLVALGTAVVTDEDAQCNGYIRTFKVDSPRPDADRGPREKAPNDARGTTGSQPASEDGALKLRLFAKDYLRGSVSSISETMGFLAVAHGQQIHVYNFYKGLEPVGFFDTEVFMADMKSVRNLLVLGEQFRGPRLVNFGLQPHRMDLLSSGELPSGKQQAPLTTVAGVSRAYTGDLCVVSCDASGRLQVLQYDPENPESAGGTKFVPQASFHTGRKCTGLAAVELGNEDLVAYGATQEGVLFEIAPISEEVFRTLYILTQQMLDKEQPLAGLNPREHRQMLATPGNHQNRLIDLNYAQRLWDLPLDRQIAYSRKLGFNGLSRSHRVLNVWGRDSLKLY